MEGKFGVRRRSRQTVIVAPGIFELNMSGLASRQRPLHVQHSSSVYARRLVDGRPSYPRVSSKQ